MKMACPEDGIGAEKTDAGGVFERCLAVTAHDLEEFELRLREVGGERAPGVARMGGCVAQGRFRAGLDLARIDDAAEPSARVLLRAIHDPDGFLEVAPAARFVPFELELVPILELPHGVGEERADVHPKTAPAGAIEPPFDRARQVHHGGDAGEQELGIGHLHRRLAPRLVEGEGAGPLVESGVVHPGDAVVLPHSLAGGFGMRVGVDVDEARHHEPPRAVDGPVRVSFVAASDLNDAAARERDVPVVKIAVAFAVPRRDPGRVADDRGVVGLGHGSASEVNSVERGARRAPAGAHGGPINDTRRGMPAFLLPP